jgi:hypothetical protein
VWELYNRKLVKVAEKIVVKLERGVHDVHDEVILMELVANFISIAIGICWDAHRHE